MIEAAGRVSFERPAAAAKHGSTRAERGYSIPMVVEEASILQNIVSKVVQEQLLEIDISTLVGDVMKIGENLRLCSRPRFGPS
jgi:hypothetical protein